jgi:hypothetical protein
MLVIIPLVIALVALTALLFPLTNALHRARVESEQHRKQREVARTYLARIAQFSEVGSYSYEQAQVGLRESVSENPELPSS